MLGRDSGVIDPRTAKRKRSKTLVFAGQKSGDGPSACPDSFSLAPRKQRRRTSSGCSSATSSSAVDVTLAADAARSRGH